MLVVGRCQKVDLCVVWYSVIEAIVGLCECLICGGELERVWVVKGCGLFRGC